MAKFFLKIPGRLLEVGADVGTAFASPSQKEASSSLPEAINIYHTGKGLHLENLFDFLPSKCIKNQQIYTHLHH